MRTTSRLILVLTLVIAMAAPLLAAERKRKGKGQRPARKADPTASAFALPKEIQLTDEQKEKVAALKSELGPKLLELVKQQNAILTDEQKQAQRDFFKEAKESGRKRDKSFQQELTQVLKLTDDQKKEMAENRKAQGQLRRQIKEKLADLLTDEQRAQLPKPKRAGKGKKNKD